MSILNRIFYKRRKFYDDDFDWESYTADSYERRLVGVVEKQNQAVAEAGELRFDAQTGCVIKTGRPLHPNQHLIYEAIGQLQPKSVHEVGCGAGDHLSNAIPLYTDIKFSGSDRGVSQLELARSRHASLKDNLGLQDITMSFSKHWPQTDMVYSQAVLMHIHTAVSHFVALTNMVNMSKRYVLLMENYQCHNFVEDIIGLRDGGHFDWDDTFIYRFDGSTGARAILLSRDKLDLPELHNDAQIRKGLKVSNRRLKRAAEDTARATFGY